MSHHLRRWTTLAAVAAVLAAASGCARTLTDRRETATPLAGSPGGSSTSRAALDATVTTMRARVAKVPGDAKSAVLLADALLRQTRVVSNAGLAIEAEQALQGAISAHPDDYDAHRMLAAVYASQHRFRDALSEANRCLLSRTDDAWVYGVIGDAHIELGEYREAFDALDRMAAHRPNAASYSRASYARELQGDLEGALRFMRMATEATSAQDPESLAWHYAQIGHLLMEIGQTDAAERMYAHADYAFPGHPFAAEGLARVAAAKGQYAAALEIVNRSLAQAPTAATLGLAGDLLITLGRPDDAERQYRLAEAAWQSDTPDPPRLARFLAERGRRLDDAVRIAESAVADRHDIFTEDALAWAYFKTGRFDQASEAIKHALSTNSRDRVMRYHAAAIARATGHVDEARRLLAEALDGSPRFDLVAAPAATVLRAALDSPTIARR